MKRIEGFLLCGVLTVLVGSILPTVTAGQPRSSRDRGKKERSGRVAICHCPPGNPDHCRTITVGAPAVRAHLGHGDTRGSCMDETIRETACCTPDGCLDRIAPRRCLGLAGVPFGLCASCADVRCPDPGCIGATGSCHEAHETPGCGALYCCDQICRRRPSCCTARWDETCAASSCRSTDGATSCCTSEGTCAQVSSSICVESGGEIPSTSECLGDANADGVDDACACGSSL